MVTMAGLTLNRVGTLRFLLVHALAHSIVPCLHALNVPLLSGPQHMLPILCAYLGGLLVASLAMPKLL